MRPPKDCWVEGGIERIGARVRAKAVGVFVYQAVAPVVAVGRGAAGCAAPQGAEVGGFAHHVARAIVAQLLRGVGGVPEVQAT